MTVYQHPSILIGDPHDARLAANVHPVDWVNPAPAPQYDMVVIGAGTAGLVTAAGAAALGAKVALIERELMGGDCLNVGCVPSKALIHSSRLVADAHGLVHSGCASGSLNVEFSAVMNRLRSVRTQISHHDSADRFKKLGVDMFLGAGKFIDAHTVEVADARLAFKRAVIASGARALIPTIPGLAEARVFTNETIFTLTALPEKCVVVGAGPIGCELGQAFARLGSKVTVITNGAAILPREDVEAAQIIHAGLIRDGVDVVVNAKITAVKNGDRLSTLEFTRNGVPEAVPFDAILVATGRAPNIDSLNLTAAGVAFDTRLGVKVDDHLRTTNKRIFAAGDVCSQYKFTHAADAMARIVIQNALFFGRKKVSDLVIPWCTYTSPEVAHVGWTASDAARHTAEIQTVHIAMAEVDRAVLNCESEGFLKVYVGKKTGQILGATLVGAHAGEMISELTVAMAAGVGLGKLGSVIHPYPTQAEIIKRAGDAYNRQRLTPRAARWLRTILKLNR